MPKKGFSSGVGMGVGGEVPGNEATFGTSAKMKTSTLSKAPPTADPKCQHWDCYKRAACHVKDTPPPPTLIPRLLPWENINKWILTAPSCSQTKYSWFKFSQSAVQGCPALKPKFLKCIYTIHTSYTRTLFNCTCSTTFSHPWCRLLATYHHHSEWWSLLEGKETGAHQYLLLGTIQTVHLPQFFDHHVL